MDSDTRLPWKVIERVIDHSRDHLSTLRSFSLTCRHLRPHSHFVMFARVRFKSRDHVFAFVDFLQDNPRLKPVVQSIVIPPVHLAPFPLLYILPNISDVEFVRDADQSASQNPFSDLHPSTTICCHRFGTNVQTLRLSGICFTTYLPFAGVLLAFANVKHLICEHVTTKAKGAEGSVNVTRRRLSTRMQLKALTIDSSSLIGDCHGRGACPGQLLFHPDLAPSTIERLRMVEVSFSDCLPPLPDWSRLRYLALQSRQLEESTKLLDSFPTIPRLSEITLEYHSSSVSEVITELRPYGTGVQHRWYAMLEEALPKFPLAKVIIICTLRNPARVNTLSFWGFELGKHLHIPLRQPEDVVVLKCEEVLPPGHEGRIRSLVVSPDSKWVATGSDDSTIILWRSDDGTIAQQWVAHGCASVLSLAFSPDSWYLVSGGDDKKAWIWDLRDLSHGAYDVSVLGGRVLTCAWSPDGSTIAIGSADGSMRLRDTRTWTLQLTCHHVRASVTGLACLAFSPDGRWLAYGPSSYECDILNPTLPPLQKSFWSYQVDDSHGPQSFHASPCAIAFDPHGARFATASSGSYGITVVDVETGRKLLCLEDEGLESLQDVTFSPDGKLMLGALTTAGMKMVYVWDASSGVEQLALKGHTDTVRRACFSPCGKYIASASDDRTVRLWSTREGSSMATFFEHQDHVEHLAFSPDGKILSSGSSEGMVIIRRMHDVKLTDDLEQDLQGQPVGAVGLPIPSESQHFPALPIPSGSLPRSHFAVVVAIGPLRLPWDVINCIIDHSAAHMGALCSLSLSCRQLLPRSRHVMFSQVSLKNRDRVFAFIGCLQANPELKPLVHTIITTSPDSFGPSLLYMLPNLSSIHYVSEILTRSLIPIPLHHISLSCFMRLGTRVKTLHLSHLSFSTPHALAQVLLQFTCLTHLICKHVEIETAGNEAVLERLERRLSKQMCLKALNIDSRSMTAGNRGACPGGLLFRSVLAPSTVESLRLIEGDVVLSSRLLPYQSYWHRLQYLVLQLRQLHEGVEPLENLPKFPSLIEVTLEWNPFSVKEFAIGLSLHGTKSSGNLAKLEESLLKFPRPNIKCTIQTRSANSRSCWTRELTKHFPVLSQRGTALVLQYTEGFPAGHDDKITILVVSPDSKWVASSSRDCTVILWDVNSGAIAQQWVAHSYKVINSLDFSPDSRYLLSGGSDNKAAIWDLGQGARLVAVLEPEGNTGPVWRCAWSPSGKFLATGSTDTGRLWDALTFQQLGLCHLKGVVNCLSFSSDECWLICKSAERDCSIFHVASCTQRNATSSERDVPSYGLHCGPHPHYHFTRTVAAVAAPEIVPVTFGSSDRITVEIIEMGHILTHENPWDMRNISFSSDGKLVVGTETRNTKTIYVWDAFTNVKLLALEGHTVAVRKACFSPCGKYIASASDDWTVRLWKTSDGSCVATFYEHKHCVEHVVFSPDGQTLSSGGNDGMVVIRQRHDIIPKNGQGLQLELEPQPTDSDTDALESGRQGQHEALTALLRPDQEGEPEGAEADEWTANYGNAGSDSSTEDYKSARSDSPTEDYESARSDSPTEDYESTRSYSSMAEYESAQEDSSSLDYEVAEVGVWMADNDSAGLAARSRSATPVPSHFTNAVSLSSVPIERRESTGEQQPSSEAQKIANKEPTSMENVELEPEAEGGVAIMQVEAKADAQPKPKIVVEESGKWLAARPARPSVLLDTDREVFGTVSAKNHGED